MVSSGNFVTLGASLVHGTSGATAKVLALPVFCATVFCVRVLQYGIERRGLAALGTFLTLELVLLTLGGLLARCEPRSLPDVSQQARLSADGAARPRIQAAVLFGLLIGAAPLFLVCRQLAKPTIGLDEDRMSTHGASRTRAHRARAAARQRARPSGVLGPVLIPPCNLHLPFFIAGA